MSNLKFDYPVYEHPVELSSPLPNINSALFTHLICIFTYINTSTKELLLRVPDQPYISTFASTIKRNNPSVIPLLSIWPQNGSPENHENLSNFLRNKKDMNILGFRQEGCSCFKNIAYTFLCLHDMRNPLKRSEFKSHFCTVNCKCELLALACEVTLQKCHSTS
ncbi:hypothetical protein OSB04_015227 [Centaurea solstitialis]|uniref:Uncharacterized protein n=1 Tax=Centaurea solstitialis TaxID=347529 RepID=A0AA38W791_9ASTR|nr:hypothetical protein OSB04_015227 [Centaurea solstitialis]